MSANSRSYLFRTLTALFSLASLSALISLPATAQMEVNSRKVNELSGNNSQTEQSLERAKPGTLLVAQSGIRSIADELVTANDAFSTLSTALRSAGLLGTLAGRGPYTIFAPIDEAFRKLPRGTVQSLLRPENRGRLSRILTYHVVPGDISSFGLRPGSVLRLRTLQGQPVTVRVTNASEVYVNGAKVVIADIPARNGMIHGISAVLLP